MRTTMLMSIQFCRRNMRIMIHFTLYLLSVELRGASRRAGRIGRTFTIINKNWDFKDISNFNFNYKNPKSVERCSLHAAAWDSNLNTSKTSSQSHKILSFLDHKWITTLPPGTVNSKAILPSSHLIYQPITHTHSPYPVHFYYVWRFTFFHIWLQTVQYQLL